MKFFALIALFGAASATTAVGIEMLQQLDMVDQKMENLSNVKHALVDCSAAGDCSQEAASMPNLALAGRLPLKARFESCVRDNGKPYCMAKLDQMINLLE